MKNDAEAVRESEKVMFRSFLLEHGYKDLGELMSRIEASPADAKRRAKA
jgi:hypothetical protein